MLFRHASRGSLHQANLGFLIAQGVLVFIILEYDGPLEGRWLLLLPGLLLAVAFWFGNLRRYRAITDHPTSRVASAPQGYVELRGTASGEDGFMLTAPLSGMPCLWYRYTLEERRGNDWVRVDSGESDDHLLLLDATGKCLLDPEGAEIHSTHSRHWGDGQYRRAEWLIKPGDPLYAIGEHRAIGGANSDFDARADLHALLSEWKRDKAALLRRYDADGNGEIDGEEWARARRDAEAAVRQQHLEIATRDGFHVMRRPAHGRLYLIANLPPARLALHYRLWSGLHLAAFFAWLLWLGGHHGGL